LAAKPASVDFVTAGALPLVGVSAVQALVDHIGLESGQKILIHGGAGGIGPIAIQLAKHLGAYVSTTARPGDSDFVKGLGADEVINYESQDFSTLIKDYDAVYDVVGGETLEKSFMVLKPGGTVVTMASLPNGDDLAKQYGVTYIAQFTQMTPERLAKLTGFVDDGTITVHIDKVFPLAEAADALEYLKTDHPRGKVVLRVKEQG
jgi:NADPH:quinone reductase-like Zn-dependent oxidoreductase